MHSSGGINYQVLADNDRMNLFIALTKNDGGGYHSKERVNLTAVEGCLAPFKGSEPFPSKVLKDSFKSKSSNNAGFMCATLRDLGLTAASLDVDSKHVVAGDWPAWRQKMFGEAGTLVQLPADPEAEKPDEDAHAPGHKDLKKPLGIPAKKGL
jgi:hypothetical protein